MRARWWYQGEKERNVYKIKLFISRSIKMYTRGFETEYLFLANFKSCFPFFKN